MKKLIYSLLILSVSALVSCVEDEGSYSYTPVNDITIEGIESNYEALAFFDNVTISPEISGSEYGEDLSNYEYAWYICRNNHTHDTICREKDLDWKADVQPGNHTLYLSVKDKTTGYDKSSTTTIQATSPYTKGYIILGNRPKSDLLGFDMLAMVPGRDVTYVQDAFDNSEYQLRNAKSMLYTGFYSRATRFYVNTEEASYCLTFGNSFDMIAEFNQFGLIETVVPHKEPKKIVDIAPQQGGQRMYSPMYPRVYLTEDLAFAARPMFSEDMNEPFNKYSATSEKYFKFYPLVFYNTRKNLNTVTTSGASPIVLYDMENDRFSYISAYGLNYMNTMENNPSHGIYVNNKPYGRTIVYGENDYTTSNGYCNAIMKDADNKYYLYRFYLEWFYNSIAVRGGNTYNLDLSTMTDFLSREHMFISSYYSLIYYSVGNTLYAYDYVNKRLGSKTFEGNITYLAPDIIYGYTPNSYWVATYDGEKGHIYNMETTNNPNEIEFIDIEDGNWEVNLEVKSILYKGQASY